MSNDENILKSILIRFWPKKIIINSISNKVEEKYKFQKSKNIYILKIKNLNIKLHYRQKKEH
ncbi:MAG: Uncharacterised protein [Flavobacteriaceae bacterium]|jgi:hypothetical protein|nr:MAG: Uncharacterised protein [Flavobacteriaceae bacterium]